MGSTYKHLGGKKIKKEHVRGGKRKEKKFRGRAPDVS